MDRMPDDTGSLIDQPPMARLGGHRLARFIGTDSIQSLPPLTSSDLVKLGSLLAVWRGAILLFSYLWGRQGVIPHWPDMWANMWLWRYSVSWDAGWYLTIARDGYGYQAANGNAPAVSWFPALPLLIHAVHTVMPGSDVLAALIVVHLALAVAIIYIYQIVRMSYPDAVALRTVTFLLVFPSAFFFSAVYAESPLLLGFAGTLYHARRGQWLRAGAFAAFASATRPVGIVIAGSLLLEILAQGAWRRHRVRALGSLITAPLGLVAYFVYLQARFGDFRIFFRVDERAQRHAFQPAFLTGLRWLLGDHSAAVFYPNNIAPLKSAFVLMDTSLLWIFLVAGIVCWWRLRPSYGALVLGGVLVPALSGSPAAMNRYVVVLFPAFILLGMIKSEGARTALMMLFTFGLVFTTWLFINGLWAG